MIKVLTTPPLTRCHGCDAKNGVNGAVVHQVMAESRPGVSSSFHLCTSCEEELSSVLTFLENRRQQPVVPALRM